MVYGAWCMEYGKMVYGVMVHGVLCMVHGVMV
jgi:hypothetical protein